MLKSNTDFISYLKTYQDLEYKKFHQKLTFTKYEIIGIRVPTLRKIANEILRSNYHKFLLEVGSEYYEEVFVEGLVIASLNEDELFTYLPTFIDKIDDWAICDSFCNSLKVIKNNPNKYFEYFKDYLKSSSEFVVRVGLVIFLNFYVTEDYIKEIFKLIDNIQLDKYYVNMAIAWLLCECFIKFSEVTENYLKITKINDFTFNKTISKIRDSYRADKEIKERLKKMMRYS